MSVKNTISVLCVISYSVYQVSSLNCYDCVSPLDGECFKNPKKKEHEITCADTRTAHLSNISALDGSDGSYASGPFDCCTLTGNGLGTKVIHRSCQPKSLTDEDIKKAVIALGIKSVDSLQRCGTDLCNSNSDNAGGQSTPSPGSSSSGSPGSSSSVSPGSSSSASPGSSSKLPPASSSKAPPVSSSKAPSSTAATTSSPGSSSTISIEFWCLACSLLSIFLSNCKSLEFAR